MARYVALVDGNAGAYGVTVPDLLGCTSGGTTTDEALRNAVEAVRLWAEDAIADGEALRAAWFAATDDARRRNLADEIQQRAFQFVPYIPTGQLIGRRAFRKNLAGVIDAPLPFLWNIKKQP